MAQDCETCGQPLVDEPHTHATWLGPTGQNARSDGVAEPPHRSRDRRLMMLVAGLAVAWLTVVGLGRLAAPDEVAEIPYAPTATPASALNPTPDPIPDNSNQVSGEQSPDSTEPEAALGVMSDDDVTQLGSRSGATVQVERLVRQLTRRGTELSLAYQAGDGIVIVHLSGGTASVVTPTPTQFRLAPNADPSTVELAPTDTLLRSGGQTFAIDPASGSVRLVAQDASLITTHALDGSMYWVPGRDLQGQAAEVLALTEDTAEWFRAPHARQLVIADGLGLLAVAKGPEGGTLLAEAGEFVELSDHRVLDASASAVLEQACVKTEPCRFLVRDLGTGIEWQIPDGFVDTRDQFALSPDGRAVLRHTPDGFAEIFDADDQNVAWVTGASMHDVAWGPDSNLVTWIDLLGAPELRVMFLDERDWLRIDLDDLGLPRPIGTELVVFEQPTSDPEAR